MQSNEIVNEFFALSKKIEDEWKIPMSKQQYLHQEQEE